MGGTSEDSVLVDVIHNPPAATTPANPIPYQSNEVLLLLSPLYTDFIEVSCRYRFCCCKCISVGVVIVDDNDNDDDDDNNDVKGCTKAVRRELDRVLLNRFVITLATMSDDDDADEDDALTILLVLVFTNATDEDENATIVIIVAVVVVGVLSRIVLELVASLSCL
jgi:hypothetical protein